MGLPAADRQTAEDFYSPAVWRLCNREGGDNSLQKICRKPMHVTPKFVAGKSPGNPTNIQKEKK
jgi:hypothetical protein